MDKLVAARKLVAELVKTEQLEVRRVEIVGRDLAALIESSGRPPTGPELEAWLGAHPQVAEVYAGSGLLDELVVRYLVPPPVVATIADARHPELERQLAVAPENTDLHLVYADWLQERQDPLGELIALGVAATASGSDEDRARFDRHLKLHEARLLGGLARPLAGRIELHWRNGFVRSATQIGVSESSKETWAELLQLRVCAMLESLRVRRAITPEVDATIAEHAPASLVDLTIDGGGPHPTRPPEQLLQRELRSLNLGGDGVQLGPNTLPKTLERLVLRVPDVMFGTVPAFPIGVRDLEVKATLGVVHFLRHGAQLPRVERLAFVLGGTDARGVVDLLEANPLPALTSLTIRDGFVDAATLARFAKLPVAKQLATLALTDLELDDTAVAPLTSLASLESLEVSHNELTDAGLERLRAVVGRVVTTGQHGAGHGRERRVRAFGGSRLDAAEGIADQAAWTRAGVDGELQWARYRGSDDEYELFVTHDLQRYGCTCPSRFQPCKHVVALALVGARGALPVAASPGLEERVAQGVRDRTHDYFDAVRE